jgi:hypothetical protein
VLAQFCLGAAGELRDDRQTEVLLRVLARAHPGVDPVDGEDERDPETRAAMAARRKRARESCGTSKTVSVGVTVETGTGSCSVSKVDCVVTLWVVRFSSSACRMPYCWTCFVLRLATSYSTVPSSSSSSSASSLPHARPISVRRSVTALDLRSSASSARASKYSTIASA